MSNPEPRPGFAAYCEKLLHRMLSSDTSVSQMQRWSEALAADGKCVVYGDISGLHTVCKIAGQIQSWLARSVAPRA